MSQAIASRLVLVWDPRVAPAPSAPMRRYRLARLSLDGGASGEGERFAYLKRSYD